MPRRHRGEQLFASVENANACRAIKLVTREGVEVATQRAHVDLGMGDRLRAVDEHHRANFVCGVDYALHGEHGTERIRDLSDRHEHRAGAQQAEEFIEHELAAQVDRSDLECAACLLAQHLPGNDVGVMLQARDQDFIAGLEARPAISLRDQVDGFRRAADKDDLACGARIDELPDALAGAFERLGRCLAERVDAAVDVGMRVGFVVLDRTQHRKRPLRRGCAIQVNERPAVDTARQDRKVAPDALRIEARRGGYRLHRSGRGGGRHHNNSCRAAVSLRWPARLCSICRRSSGILILATTSSRNAHLSSRCAVSRSRPRDNR